RLSALADAAIRAMPALAATLGAELDRAEVLPPGRTPPANVAAMGRAVTYRDETTGRVQTVTLVYPEAADIEAGRISVLTPVGTALIGLAAGRSIDWETRTGETRRLTVLGVGPG